MEAGALHVKFLPSDFTITSARIQIQIRRKDRLAPQFPRLPTVPGGPRPYIRAAASEAQAEKIMCFAFSIFSLHGQNKNHFDRWREITWINGASRARSWPPLPGSCGSRSAPPAPLKNTFGTCPRRPPGCAERRLYLHAYLQRAGPRRVQRLLIPLLPRSEVQTS